MRGQLKPVILKLLDDKSMSGSEIIKELETKMNWKPSCGSIYPLLKTLEKEELTTSKQESGKKTYKITKKAKKYIKEKEQEKEELIQTMEKSYHLLESVYGIKTNTEREMLDELKQGQVPFHEIYEETITIKEELIRIKKAKQLTKNLTKIKKILKQTGTELKKIR